MKKVISKKVRVVLSLALAAVVCLSSTTNTEAASKKYVKSLKVAKTSVSIEAGSKTTVNATVKVAGSASKKVTAKSSDSKVASVKTSSASKRGVSKITITAKKAGKATITVKASAKNSKKKTVSKTIKVTVKGETSVNPSNPLNPSTQPSVQPSTQPGVQPSAQSGVQPSAQPGVQPSTQPGVQPSTQPGVQPSAQPDVQPSAQPDVQPSAQPAGFTRSDYTVEYEVVHKMVDFDINTDVITKEELSEMGYTISADGKSASKDNALLKATFTFQKLPTSLDDLMEFDLSSENVTIDGITYDAGMLKPMAANILAIHAGNITNRLDANTEICQMLDYLEGPNQTISNAKRQLINGNVMDNKDVRNCYFVGATPENAYTPATPYQIVVEEGPYYIPAKVTINGNRPETHMAFVFFAGADTERYIDVFKSSDGNWYTWQDNCTHLTASIKPAATVW